MGHWDIVWYLNDTGADLSRTPTNSHSTLVLSAVRHRSVDALKELARRGVDLNQRQWNGATILHEAARTGDGAMVGWLVSDSGLDINATNDQKEGAVHEAALMGHTDVVWKLIAAGADVGEPGSSAVHVMMNGAIQHSNLELLDLLQVTRLPLALPVPWAPPRWEPTLDPPSTHPHRPDTPADAWRGQRQRAGHARQVPTQRSGARGRHGRR